MTTSLTDELKPTPSNFPARRHVAFWWKCDRGGQAIERGPGAFVGAAFSGGRWQRLVVWRRLVGLRGSRVDQVENVLACA
jgi:hypothetical protein